IRSLRGLLGLEELELAQLALGDVAIGALDPGPAPIRRAPLHVAAHLHPMPAAIGRANADLGANLRRRATQMRAQRLLEPVAVIRIDQIAPLECIVHRIAEQGTPASVRLYHPTLEVMSPDARTGIAGKEIEMATGQVQRLPRRIEIGSDGRAILRTGCGSLTRSLSAG